MYSSKQVAEMGNVTKKTLRHYDKIKLLSPSFVDDNGYWYYDDQALADLQIIKSLQTLGFSLSEIKENVENNFNMIRTKLDKKKRYVDEQMVQLNLAKRLLTSIEAKPDLPVQEALRSSMEEEHINWYKRNLTEEEYDLVDKMSKGKDAMALHDTMIESFKSFKQNVNKKNELEMYKDVITVFEIFNNQNFNKETSYKLIEFFLQSNLEGPLNTRLLSINHVVMFLNCLKSMDSSK